MEAFAVVLLAAFIAENVPPAPRTFGLGTIRLPQVSRTRLGVLLASTHLCRSVGGQSTLGVDFIRTAPHTRSRVCMRRRLLCAGRHVRFGRTGHLGGAILRHGHFCLPGLACGRGRPRGGWHGGVMGAIHGWVVVAIQTSQLPVAAVDAKVTLGQVHGGLERAKIHSRLCRTHLTRLRRPRPVCRADHNLAFLFTATRHAAA